MENWLAYYGYNTRTEESLGENLHPDIFTCPASNNLIGRGTKGIGDHAEIHVQWATESLVKKSLACVTSPCKSLSIAIQNYTAPRGLLTDKGRSRPLGASHGSLRIQSAFKSCFNSWRRLAYAVNCGKPGNRVEAQCFHLSATESPPAATYVLYGVHHATFYSCWSKGCFPF